MQERTRLVAPSGPFPDRGRGHLLHYISACPYHTLRLFGISNRVDQGNFSFITLITNGQQTHRLGDAGMLDVSWYLRCRPYGR